jgi:uncharacterized protein (TIGR02466 family)
VESPTNQTGNASMANAQGSASQSSGHAVTMFPTICFITEHPDVEQMNRELEQFCLTQETTHPRLQTGSIQGGYHSNRQIFDHDNPAIQQLKKLLIGNARSYLNEYWKQESTIPLASVENLSLQMTGWSVILRQGDISTPHTHPGAHLSGVYYVTMSEEARESQPGAGDLVLVDPRIRASVAPLQGQKSNAMFTPKSGVSILFPSWLEHFVLPFKGEGVRISIAYNVALSPSAVQRD